MASNGAHLEPSCRRKRTWTPAGWRGAKGWPGEVGAKRLLPLVQMGLGQHPCYADFQASGCCLHHIRYSLAQAPAAPGRWGCLHHKTAQALTLQAGQCGQDLVARSAWHLTVHLGYLFLAVATLWQLRSCEATREPQKHSGSWWASGSAARASHLPFPSGRLPWSAG